MSKSKTTIHDIARELKVSPSTVSRALNNNPRISIKTIAAVKKTAIELNYYPNSIASALRSGRSMLLGVVIPTANRYFFGNILKSIENIASDNNYSVLIAQSNDDAATEIRMVENLMKARVDGILLSKAKSTKNTDHYQQVIDSGLPLILFDRVVEKIDAHTVTIDDFKSAYEATEHLITQGYSRIAHFHGPLNTKIYKDRFEGYKQALRDNEIDFDPILIKESFDLSREEGRRMMTELLQITNIDGLLAASDFAALGALHICQERHIRVPEEVGIVGYANEPFTTYIQPDLTTVDQNPEKIGKIGAELFFQHLTAINGFEKKTIQIDSTLIVRNSSNRNKYQLIKNNINDIRK
jgi:LacI family transcriptional regulator